MLVDQPGRRPGQRRIGAHATGVRPGVAVADPLEVLRGQQRHRDRAVDDREQRHLGTGEVLLDQHRVPAASRPGVRAGGVESSVTTTPLPAASPSSLTTYGGVKPASFDQPRAREDFERSGEIQHFDIVEDQDADALYHLSIMKPRRMVGTLLANSPSRGVPVTA